MDTVCDKNMCTACSACVDICPRQAVSLRDSIKFVDAVIDEEKCIRCGLCKKVCQKINALPLSRPIEWYQGWLKDEDERIKSSSGGFAYAVSRQIIKENGYVASCRFINGEFRYSLVDSLEELDKFRGSRYVKSNPSGIYKKIDQLLKKEKAVLFIGLPCHVAALKRFIGREESGLITVDLICHGSPSSKLLDLFLKQYNIDLSTVKDVRFRQKGKFRLTVDTEWENESKERYFTEKTIRDRYTIAFLKGIIYTQNCYSCVYARTERVSDITIGDCWGSDLDNLEKEKGISLALCQSEKGSSLIKRCGLNLNTVDLNNAIEANHQLKEPYPIPDCRNMFFEKINQGYSFNRAVGMCYPRICFKTGIKNTMIRYGLIKPNEK